MYQNISKLNWLKIGKIVAGSVIAMLISQILNLDNSVSAGIITFLTIQDTRQQTTTTALQRILAFIIMTVICFPIFHFFGGNPLSFGLFFLIFLFICFLFNLKDSIAVNTVIATHYMIYGDVDFPILKNEFLLLIIGVGVGILINSFMPDNKKKIIEKQKEVDKHIQQIFRRMSLYLLKSDRTGYDGSCFYEVDKIFKELENEILLFMQNHYIDKDLYFMCYAELRRRQAEILRMMYRQVMRITLIPEQAKPLSEFIKKVSIQYNEKNDSIALLDELESIYQNYKNSPLPLTREEFENRAILYSILSDLYALLQMKKQFYESITSKDKN